MSAFLWRYFLEDDVDRFRQVLEESTGQGRPHTQKSNPSWQDTVSGLGVLGSPRLLPTSPTATPRPRNGFEATSVGDFAHNVSDNKLSKADVNRTDGKGLTILHYAASAASQQNAQAFSMALLAHHLIDLYIQDHENGWTALHRAFYFGNITIARAIIQREAELIAEHGTSASIINTPRLIKVKDKEGNGPYDLIGASIRDRTLFADRRPSLQATQGDEDDGSMADSVRELSKTYKSLVEPMVNVDGDELYTFGSNKNLTLGFPDQDDRQFPEQPHVKRPDHIYKRFHKEYIQTRADDVSTSSQVYAEKIVDASRSVVDPSQLPTFIRARPVKFQDVQMAKFHTAVLTTDPTSNLYVCGHGPGGRLGLGNDKTQFRLSCVEDFGGGGRRRIVAVALGQDHTLAVTDQGEIFTWGSNAYGQLGTGIPKENSRSEDLVQNSPKQIFGVMKREIVLGVAASRFHSVAHSANDIFTWGKNEGQLGLVDAGARSLELQATPRNITPSRFSSGIHSVAATEKATVCMLNNNEIFVFANYGMVKLEFPVNSFASQFLSNSFSATKYVKDVKICKITCGGDTICGLSTAGEVYTVTVKQLQDPASSASTSTTNPNKIKAGLSKAVCVWSLKKDSMAARDVGVDQDGSVILTTESGGVWRRVRRNKIGASAIASRALEQKSKDFKFSRVPSLTRVVAVRASGSGAYCAMRHDCDVTRTQIATGPQQLWDDLLALLPFKELAELDESDLPAPSPAFWRRPGKLEKIMRRLAQSKDPEKVIADILINSKSREGTSYDVAVSTTSSEVTIPGHQFLLSARSPVLRAAFTSVQQGSEYSTDFVTVRKISETHLHVVFDGLDFLAIAELMLYFYTDAFVGYWQYARTTPALAYRYKQVRTDITKASSRLELPNLESAVRRVVNRAEPSLDKDMELAISDPSYFQNGDILVQLKDGDEVLAHSPVLVKRCPYFEALFEGAARGQWLTQRRQLIDGVSKAIEVTLDDVSLPVFKLVLRHMYADTGSELFDEVTVQTIDDFLDFVLEVQEAANFLMLDRLSQICQLTLGKFVTTRTVGFLLTEVAQCSVTDFKEACLEYLCLNLEAVLSNHLLDDLDDDLMLELDSVFRDNQLACLPFAKSGRADAILFDRYPELSELVYRGRQAKLDAIALQAKLADPNIAFGRSIDMYDEDFFSMTPGKQRRRHRPSANSSAAATPALRPQPPISETDTEHDFALPSAADISPLPNSRKSPNHLHSVGSPISPLGLSVPWPGSLTSRHQPASPIATPSPETAFLPRTSSEPKAAPERSRSQPWGVTPLSTAKLGIKDIISQASQSRHSGIALGLDALAATADRPSGSFNARLSQKDRKKLQQQGKTWTEPAKVESERSQDVKPPWQAVTANASSPAAATNTKLSTNLVAPPAPGRSMTTPQLTMRQTVANIPANKSKHVAQSIEHPQAPSTPQRSVSTPQITPIAARGTTASPTTPSSSNSQPIQIQSIKHTPSRNQTQKALSSFMHQSLADIISHEQAEKLSIQEAAKSRSLAEIQQEQAFEEWWNAESKAVQEEAARASKSTNSNSSSRNKSKSGGRGAKNRHRPGRTKDSATSSKPT